jgi:hypothetical protein
LISKALKNKKKTDPKKALVWPDTRYPESSGKMGKVEKTWAACACATAHPSEGCLFPFVSPMPFEPWGRSILDTPPGRRLDCVP